MEVSLAGESFGFIPIEPLEVSHSSISDLCYVPSSAGPKLATIDEDGGVCEVWEGVRGDPLYLIETPSKPTEVFTLLSRPELLVVSLVGATSVLEIQGGTVRELDQSQTRISLSEPTVFCGDGDRGVCVQASRSWVNFFSNVANVVYKTSHSERIVSCSSRLGRAQALIALGDGELRGRGRVVLLEVSAQGEVFEKARKDVLQELVGVALVPGVGSVAITTDNSVLLFSDSDLALKSHLRMNSPLRSIASFQDGTILVGTMTGLVCRIEGSGNVLKLKSTRIVSSEPISFSPSQIPGKFFALSRSRSFLVDSSGELTRIHIGLDPLSAASSGNSALYAVLAHGAVQVSRMETLDKTTEQKIFSRLHFASFPKNLFDTLEYDSSHMLLLVRDSPPVIYSGGGAGRQMYSLGNVDSASAVEIAQERFLLVHSIDRGFCLVRNLCETVWIKPETGEEVCGLLQVGESYFMAISKTFSSIDLFSLRLDKVPRLVARKSLGFDLDRVKLHSLQQTARIILVDASAGVFSLWFEMGSVFVTAVPGPHKPVSRITASAALDNDTVVTGHEDGTVSVLKIPKSVLIDEKESNFSKFSPNLCMTTVDTIASLQVSSKPISSLLRSRDGRHVVYLASAGSMGALFRSPIDSSPGICFLSGSSHAWSWS